MKNVGLFFGSFNPIHFGHLAVAEFFNQQTELEEVWMVISPQSPFKNQDELMENHHRLAMVELAIENNPKFKTCIEEFNLPKPNYTIDTLQHMETKYPDHQFTLLLGEDNVAYFDGWRDYEQILDDFQIYVYPRSESEKIKSELLNHPKIKFFHATLLEVSGTKIRETIKNKKSLSDLIPTSVKDYIQKNNPFS